MHTTSAAAALTTLAPTFPSPASVRGAIDAHRADTLPRLQRFWQYYRNDLTPLRAVDSAGEPLPLARGGWYRLAQEAGLPRRLARPATPDDGSGPARREVVIENDIAWRVHAMVDALFAKPVALLSGARDERRRAVIERVLDAVWERSGGAALLQDFALLGHVFGHAALVVRADEALLRAAAERLRTLLAGEDLALLEPDAALDALDECGALDPAALRIEVIDPRRACVIPDPDDYRRFLAYIVHYERVGERMADRAGAPGMSSTPAHGWLRRLAPVVAPRALSGAGVPHAHEYTEVITAAGRRVTLGASPAHEEAFALFDGQLPVAHAQNQPQPLTLLGLGEVEPLIPLQDELNTRLSDRASRVTLQSFRMYLAKGVDGFARAPIGPGAVFSTDNPDASITPFGGDAPTPGEDAHILEIREAMDKVSGVPPLAAGVVRAKIGNLSSANALRVTLLGLLSRTERKRLSYGAALTRVSGLLLSALSSSAVLPTRPAERRVRPAWPDPLPQDRRDEALAARARIDVGLDPRRVLAELGAGEDRGVE